MNLCSIVLCLSHQRRRLPEPLLPFCTAWALLIKTWFHDAERNHNSFLTNKETVSSCKSSHAETNNCFKQEKISSQSSLARIHEKHRSTLSVPDEDDELLSDLDTEWSEPKDEEDDDIAKDRLEKKCKGIDGIRLNSGRNGYGVNLGQTLWGERALTIANEVLEEFGSNFSLYAFKASGKGCVYVRLDKFSNRYGSPTMVEIESFSRIYGKHLEEEGQDGTLPSKLALEVSSPGAERVVQVPEQLERFKDLPMRVRYVEEMNDCEVLKEKVLTLASFDVGLNKSVWKLADVRINREKAGKGRGLTRKQKELMVVDAIFAANYLRVKEPNS